MPSIRALYNDELVEAHREAVATLRELLATETDRTERRKLANAILRARPAKEDASSLARAAGDRAFGSEADESRKSSSSEATDSGFATPGEGALSAAPNRRARAVHQEDFDLDHDDDFDDEDLNDPAHREIDTLAHQLQHGPDPLAAIARLQAIMKGDMESLTLSAGTPEGA